MQQVNAEDSYQFEVIDYSVFGVMLIVSALVGLYYGCGRTKKIPAQGEDSIEDEGFEPQTSEYLLGSKSMSVVPVAMSLVSSYVSGVTILGTPAEIYNFGTQYLIIVIAIWLMGFIVANVYLPVFSKLQVKSSYEYLELRFNRTVRTLISLMFVIDEILFLPIVVYVPSLAFNQVTGIDIHIVALVVCIVCVFYTTLGGIKAVVWTDTWQIIVMFLSVMMIVVLGTIRLGGVELVWKKNYEGKRLEFFNFSPSLYERQTFWGVLIGGFSYWTAYNSVNQTMVQRYMSLPSLKKAKMSVGLFTIGISFFVAACCYTGLTVYAEYADCDPLASGRIQAVDQLLPLYVMETIGANLPGVPGLFVAGVFGAALSSLSVVLNSTSAVLLEDFVKGSLNIKLRDTTATIFVKIVIVVLGIIAVSSLYIVEHLGGVLALATSLTAIAASTSFGVFTLGMLVPFANSAGATVGGIVGAIMAAWVSLGAQIAIASGNLVVQTLPTSTEGCLTNSTSVPTLIQPYEETSVFPLYRLSYLWITPIGISTVLIVGSIVSILTRKQFSRAVNLDYISPVIHRFVSSDTSFDMNNKRDSPEPSSYLLNDLPVDSRLRLTINEPL